MPHYKLVKINRDGKPSAQWLFHQSRAKVRLFGGGFGNGKTAAMCVRALQIARDYPGCNILAFRATYPKLRDTLVPEFKKWCPASWIESFPQDPLNCTLKNGSVINFRYVKQQGSGKGEQTSNLLSATYDHIFGDQIEDPEITEKDFFDLFGRLRGNAEYIGADNTMPRTGPRTMDVACNPTRNWVWRRLVRPLYMLRDGIKSPELFVHPVTGEPIIELFESSSYDNVHNTGWDYIHTLEALYTGQMRDRFLNGLWAAYEGLVYPDFTFDKHVIEHDALKSYYHKLRRQGYIPQIIEGYDHGLQSPSCYGYWFTDNMRNTFLLDGFYQKEASPEWCARRIGLIRDEYLMQYAVAGEIEPTVWADPDVFRRKTGDKKTVGRTVADIYTECEPPIIMVRGNNDIANGIVKVRSYMAIKNAHQHPITGNFGAPHLFVSDRCPWWINEVTDYMWKRDAAGEQEDVPADKNDHAMDMTKYSLSATPSVARFVPLNKVKPLHPKLFKWNEQDAADARRTNNHRYH